MFKLARTLWMQGLSKIYLVIWWTNWFIKKQKCKHDKYWSHDNENWKMKLWHRSNKSRLVMSLYFHRVYMIFPISIHFWINDEFLVNFPRSPANRYHPNKWIFHNSGDELGLIPSTIPYLVRYYTMVFITLLSS